MFPSYEIIPQINDQLERFKSSIDVIIQQNNEYRNGIKRYINKEYEIKENEDLLEKKKTLTENLMDQIEDVEERNEIILQNLNEFQNKYNELNKGIDELNRKYLVEKETFQTKKKFFGQFIFEIVELMKNNSLNNIAKIEQQLYDSYFTHYNGIIDVNEMVQLEQWTNKKCGEIIFDSNQHDWNQNTSVFNDKIENKYNLLFVVEDEQNNKFGCYLSTIIVPNTYDTWISTDNNTFLFSLKSNGRLNGMMKFEIKDTSKGYFLYYKSHLTHLISLGGGVDLHLCKQNSKSRSSCCQNTSCFNYHSTTNPFVGGNGSGSKNFTPRRITVIQMK